MGGTSGQFRGKAWKHEGHSMWFSTPIEMKGPSEAKCFPGGIYDSLSQML